MEVKGQFRTVKCSFLENQFFAVNVCKKQFRMPYYQCKEVTANILIC